MSATDTPALSATVFVLTNAFPGVEVVNAFAVVIASAKIAVMSFMMSML